MVQVLNPLASPLRNMTAALEGSKYASARKIHLNVNQRLRFRKIWRQVTKEEEIRLKAGGQPSAAPYLERLRAEFGFTCSDQTLFSYAKKTFGLTIMGSRNWHPHG